MEIDAPSYAGISSSSSSFEATNIYVSDSDKWGISISGGSPDLNYFEVTDSDETGMEVSSFADVYVAEGEITGSGTSSAGVWVNNATYTHINGYNGPNDGWDVSAENDAWVWFNGTYWSGSPYTNVDGSSTLSIQNPNNPQKSRSPPPLTEQAQLLKDWSDRYRQSPKQAAEWLGQERESLSGTLAATAIVLLTDYHLAGGRFGQAQSLLNEVSEYHKTLLEPGTVAIRNLEVALNAELDQELALESLDELKRTHRDPELVERYEAMVSHRYGKAEDQAPESSEMQNPGSLEVFNYPNPFNPVTNIQYTVPTKANVTLAVYDLLGREIAVLVNGETKSAGAYSVPFDATQLSSGIYIYRLTAGSHVRTERMTLIK